MNTIRMQGREVYRNAVVAMSKASEIAVHEAGIEPQDIKLVIPHQANVRIIDAIISRLGLSPDRAFINVDKYGNTSAASIPIALDEAVSSGALQPGDYVLLVAFGAGLTWASTLIRW